MSLAVRHPSVRSSLTAAIAEAAVVGGMFACLEAWIVPLLQGRLGAAAALIGFLAMLPQVASIAIGPITGRVIAWLGGPRRVAIHHCWVQVVGFGLLQIPLWLSAEGHPPSWAMGFAVVVVALMNGIGAVLGGPAWMAYFGGLVPHRVMGRYTGHRNRVFHISRLSFAGLFMGVMWAFPVTTSITGLQIVLATAMLSRLASTLLQFRQIDVKIRSSAAEVPAPSRGFLHFLATLPSNPFGRFTLVWSLFHLGLMVAAPYFATYLVATHTEGGLDLGSQAVLYSLLVYANAVTRLLCLPHTGRLVDRVGSVRVFRWALLLISLMPVGWITSAATGSPWPLLLIEILGGVAWAMADSCVGPLLFRCHPDPHQRAHLIAWHSTIFNSCCLVGTGLGMLLLAFPLGGNHTYLLLFAVSFVLRIPALAMARRLLPVEEPRRSTGP
jgi:hypothetical protein